MHLTDWWTTWHFLKHLRCNLIMHAEKSKIMLATIHWASFYYEAGFFVGINSFYRDLFIAIITSDQFSGYCLFLVNEFSSDFFVCLLKLNFSTELCNSTTIFPFNLCMNRILNFSISLWIRAAVHNNHVHHLYVDFKWKIPWAINKMAYT